LIHSDSFSAPPTSLDRGIEKDRRKANAGNNSSEDLLSIVRALDGFGARLAESKKVD
jgi:hypothetical protein